MNPARAESRIPYPSSTNFNFRSVYPFGKESHNRPMAPRIVPAGQSNVLRSDRDIWDLARLPGIKIVKVPSTSYINRLLALTFVKAANDFRADDSGKNSCILATGGTWDGPRMLMGTPEYAKRMLGMALPTDKGLVFSCLDEYGYDRISLKALTDKIGSRDVFLKARQNPVLYGDLHRTFLFGAGFTEKDFRFPPAGFDGPGYEAAAGWREVLQRDIWPAVVAAHGIGSFPFHDAFNDFGTFGTLTGFNGIAGSTKLQNGNDTTPPGYPRMSLMFRNIAAAYRISEPELVFRKAYDLRADYLMGNPMPLAFSHYVNVDEWSDFMDFLPDRINTARETIGRMPANVITQGLGDLIDGGMPDGRSADLHVFGVGGGQKSNAFLFSFCAPPSDENPASAANFYGRTIVFVDKLAAYGAGKHSEMFWTYMPDKKDREKTEEGCRGHRIAEEFWSARELNPAREKWADR